MVNEKGNVLVIGIIATLLIVVAGVYFWQKTSQAPQYPSSTQAPISQPSQTVSPSSTPQSSDQIESWDAKNNTFIGMSIYGGPKFSLIFPSGCSPTNSSDKEIKCQIGGTILTAIPESGGRGSTWKFIIPAENISLNNTIWVRSAATIGDNKTLFIFYGATINQTYYMTEFRLNYDPPIPDAELNPILVQTNKIMATFKQIN